MSPSRIRLRRRGTTSGGGAASLLFDGTFNTALGAYPGYGWDVAATEEAQFDTYFTATQLAGQAPSGFDAVRITAITKPNGNEAEPNGWWSKDSGLTAPSQGAAWYLRYRLRLNGAQSWAGAHNGGGLEDFKCTIVGDGGVSGNRLISHMAAGPTTADINTYPSKNIGNSAEPHAEDITHSEWHSIQIKYQSGSTSSSADGEIHFWFDNSDDGEGSPFGSLTGEVIPVADWGQVLRFGVGTLMTILDGHGLSIDFADFQLDDAFDSGY